MYSVEHLLNAARDNDASLLEMIVKDHNISINAQGSLSAKDMATISNPSGRITVPMTNDFTALHIACLHGHLNIVKKCIELGADVNPNCTTSPVHLTVISGSIPILDFLIKHGADMFKTAPILFDFSVNPQVSFNNATKAAPKPTPAAPKYHFRQVNELIQAINNHAPITDIRQFIQAGTHQKDTKASSLYFALITNQSDTVKMLLDANVPVQNKHFYAAGCANSRLLYDLIQTHNTSNIGHQKTTNTSSSSSDKKSDLEAFIAAIKLNKAYTIPSTLEHSLQQQDPKGNTLFFALTQGNVALVTLLLVHGIKVFDRHLFAAGCYQFTSKESTIAKQLYELVKAYKPNLNSTIPHEILGVPNNAPLERIKMAYNQLVLQYHPDKNKDFPQSQALFIKIQQAFHAMKITSASGNKNSAYQSPFFNSQPSSSSSFGTNNSANHSGGYSYG